MSVIFSEVDIADRERHLGSLELRLETELLSLHRYRVENKKPETVHSYPLDALITPLDEGVTVHMRGSQMSMPLGYSLCISAGTPYNIGGTGSYLVRMNGNGKQFAPQGEAVLGDTSNAQYFAHGLVGEKWNKQEIFSFNEPAFTLPFGDGELKGNVDGTWSAGSLVFTKGSEAPRHFHDVPELIYIPWGNIHLYLEEDRQWRPFQAGSAVYIPEKEGHAWGCKPQNMHEPLDPYISQAHGMTNGNTMAVMYWQYAGHLKTPQEQSVSARKTDLPEDTKLMLVNAATFASMVP